MKNLEFLSTQFFFKVIVDGFMAIHLSKFIFGFSGLVLLNFDSDRTVNNSILYVKF